MTEISYAPEAEQFDAIVSPRATAFYVISPRKFAILFIATFGLYAFYWFYRNWDQYRDHVPHNWDEAAIWPFPRSWFFIFFTHSLFSKVQSLGADKPQVARWHNHLHATLLLAVYIGSNILEAAVKHRMGEEASTRVALATLIPLAFVYTSAQKKINIACDDADGSSNNALTKGNWPWVIVGGLVWLLVIIGLLAGDPDAVSVAPSSSSW